MKLKWKPKLTRCELCSTFKQYFTFVVRKQCCFFIPTAPNFPPCNLSLEQTLCPMGDNHWHMDGVNKPRMINGNILGIKPNSRGSWQLRGATLHNELKHLRLLDQHCSPIWQAVVSAVHYTKTVVRWLRQTYVNMAHDTAACRLVAQCPWPPYSWKVERRWWQGEGQSPCHMQCSSCQSLCGHGHTQRHHFWWMEGYSFVLKQANV